MNRPTFKLCVVLTFVLLLATHAAAQSQYILGTPAANLNDVASRHGLAVDDDLNSDGGVFLVTPPACLSSQLLQQILADPAVSSFETNATTEASEVEPLVTIQIDPGAVQAILSDTSTVTFAGATVRNIYVNQPASSLIRLGLAPPPATSIIPIVAVIDTGVDPAHPALSGVLVPGYDFTTNQAGIPNELLDLSADTANALSQSATLDAALKIQGMARQSTVVILDQSTVVILDGGGTLPADFGHGTMVAGLIHLVAPTAQIMPLKAFKSDGSANLSDIIRAIYYAADHGATVISMSFDTENPSYQLKQAIAYAKSKGAICVAAAGNEGEQELAYPAGFLGVIGVGSTTPTDGRSVFSNYATSGVFMAAPGEALVTTYPGNNYAAAWGTSFSAALVSGTVALLSQTAGDWSRHMVFQALGNGQQLDPSLGLGQSRLDVFASLSSLQWEED